MNEPNVRGSMTEEEREMLELAAKAAGYKFRVSREWHSLEGVEVFIPNSGPTEHLCWHRWNPIEDDGDALRLAVRLGMCVDVRQAHTEVTPPGDRYTESEEHEDDPEAATRRAIVRAAAEIGRAM